MGARDEDASAGLDSYDRSDRHPVGLCRYESTRTNDHNVKFSWETTTTAPEETTTTTLVEDDSSNTGLIIALVVIALLVVGVLVGGYFARNRKSDETDNESEIEPPSAPTEL